MFFCLLIISIIHIYFKYMYIDKTYKFNLSLVLFGNLLVSLHSVLRKRSHNALLFTKNLNDKHGKKAHPDNNSGNGSLH